MDKYGQKTGGRKKGTPNKKTMDLIERMGDYNPLEALLNIAQDDDTPTDIKVKINIDLMGYIYPKRKSIEVKDKIQFEINPDDSQEIQDYLFKK